MFGTAGIWLGGWRALAGFEALGEPVQGQRQLRLRLPTGPAHGLVFSRSAGLHAAVRWEQTGTVTLFARFLGWSTSQPRRTPVWRKRGKQPPKNPLGKRRAHRSRRL